MFQRKSSPSFLPAKPTGGTGDALKEVLATLNNNKK